MKGGRGVINLTSFSEWVRASRRAKDLTLLEVAERAGVKQPVWSQWESGRATPRRETVIKIADALQVPHKEALMRAGYMPSETSCCDTGASHRIWSQLEPILMGLPADKQPVAERMLTEMMVEGARHIRELLTAN